MNINSDWKFMVVITLGMIALAAGVISYVEFGKSQQQHKKDIKQLKEEMERRFQQIENNFGDLEDKIQKVKSDTDIKFNTLQHDNLFEKEETKRVPSISKPTSKREKLFDDVKDFVNRFLKLDSKGNIKDIMRLYADKVNYMTKGLVGHSTIIQDKQSYFKRWPKRLYAYKPTLKVLYLNDIRVVFTFYFLIDNNIDCIDGEVEKVLLLRSKNNKLFIVSEKTGTILTKKKRKSENCRLKH